MSFLMIRTRCLVLLTVLTLSAVSSKGTAQTRLTLDEDGLSGITAATRFDMPILRNAIPSVVWKRVEQQTEDGTETVILATRHGKTGFTLYSDGRGHVSAIEIVSRRVGNSLGPRVGDAYRVIRQSGRLGACWPGMEAQSGQVICEADQSRRITYLFSGRWNGPDGQLPPASVLNDWTISQVIWRPDRFAGIGKTLVHTPEAAPAFECSKARGSIEERICRSTELARLDRRLNAIYVAKFAAVTPPEQRLLRAGQRGWIKGRNDCWKSSDPHQCVVGAYNDRIEELSEEPTSLPGTTWTGIRIAGDSIPSDIDINLTFGSDGRISGSSGCNRFFSGYSLDGRNLRIDQIGGTRRMCSEIEMLAERRFLSALERVDGWAMRNDDLILFGTGAELTFQRM